jgi:hypothetical protein
MLALAVSGVSLSAYSLVMAGADVLLAVLLWSISDRCFRFPPHLALLYPISIVLALVIAGRSVALAVRGRSTWKGRTLIRVPVRWL